MKNEILDEIENEDLILSEKRRVITVNFLISLMMILSGIVICIIAYKALHVIDTLDILNQVAREIKYKFQMLFGVYITITGYFLFSENRFGLQLLSAGGWLSVGFSLFLIVINLNNLWTVIVDYGLYLFFGIIVLSYTNWKRLDTIFE